MIYCEIYHAIGQKFKEYRQAAGISQDAIALTLNIERTSITNFEQGRQRCNVAKIKDMCDVVGIAVTDILPECCKASPDAPVMSKRQMEMARLKRRLALLEVEETNERAD